MASETGRMSVTVTPDKQARLDAIAGEADRSRSWVVNQAIEHYLDLYDWQKEKIRQRLERAETGDAVFHSSADIDALIESCGK